MAAPASPTKCSLPMLEANKEHPTAHHGALQRHRFNVGVQQMKVQSKTNARYKLEAG